MSATQALTLAVAAAAAGVVNAVAGGGTLITFPALTLVGTPKIIANATSTLALVFGTGGSVYGYRRHLAAVKPWLQRFVNRSFRRQDFYERRLSGLLPAWQITYIMRPVK